MIGNGNKATVSKRKNPVNDAADMAAAFKGLGFLVDLLRDATLDDMENAVIRLGNRLGQSPGSYGFFFYIAYATGAGSVAQDGQDRNGLFTSQLLKHLATPGLEIKDVFNRTGADVMGASNNQQVPAIYNQLFKSAWLAGQAAAWARPPHGPGHRCGHRQGPFRQGRQSGLVQ